MGAVMATQPDEKGHDMSDQTSNTSQAAQANQLSRELETSAHVVRMDSADYHTAVRNIWNRLHEVHEITHSLMGVIADATPSGLNTNTQEWCDIHDILRTVGVASEMAYKLISYRPSMLSDSIQNSRQELDRAVELALKSTENM